MSDAVLLALIVAAVVLIILVVFRKQLRSFVFRAGALEAELRTNRASDPSGSESVQASHPEGVSLTNVRMKGTRHKIAVKRGGVSMNKIRQQGKDHQIAIESDTSTKKLHE